MLLHDFENFGHIQFPAPGLRITDLATLALESPESGWTTEDGRIEDLADSVRDILVDKAAILREYYAFEISSDGYLLRIPVLLGLLMNFIIYIENNWNESICVAATDNHQPSLAHLPMYILCLATEVDWDDESRFFETFSRQTALFYANIPYADDDGETDAEGAAWKWNVEHVIYPGCKQYLLPPRQFMTNHTLLVVASLPKLYRVFERC